jgi:hypothetical protein
MISYPCSHPHAPIPILLLALTSPGCHLQAPFPTLASQYHHFDIAISMLPSQHTEPYNINLLLFSEARRKKYINCEKKFKMIEGKNGLHTKQCSYSLTLFRELFQ